MKMALFSQNIDSKIKILSIISLIAKAPPYSSALFCVKLFRIKIKLFDFAI